MQVEKFEHSVTSLDRSGAKPIISPTRYFRSFSEPTLLACKKTLQKFSCFFVFILQHKNCTTINPIMIWLLARENTYLVKANFLLLENFYGKIPYALLSSRYVGRAWLVIEVRQSRKQIMVSSIFPKKN